MSEEIAPSCVIEPPAEAPAPTSEWSVGIFARSGCQVPGPCLRECLGGDARLAQSNGCGLLRQLARRAETGRGDVGEIPRSCDRGYDVSLSIARESDEPDVLLLRPGTDPAGQVESAIEAVQATAAANWQLEQENQGLANEVLRSYEQINLIFDVSAEIAILNDAEEVRRMLLIKLRHLFDAEAVYYISSDRRLVKEVARGGDLLRGWIPDLSDRVCTTINGRGSGNSAQVQSIELPPEFPQVLRRLEQSKRVIVSAVNADHDAAGHGTSLWGPLSDDDDGFAVVGIIRRKQPFVAGDMLLLDSALTYGSHILSNLRLVEQLKRTSFEAVRALVNAIDQKDNYTYGHSERVGFLAKVVGQYMGLPARQLQELEWAGLLHDVGKIGIPEHVLNKPGRLTEEEFALIKEHPARSYEVLKPVASLEPVLDAVLYHHENPDGTGYPRGLKREEIPLMAAIVHVVDVFDALTSTRSYRGAYQLDRAMEILKHDAGTKLDAEIVEHFMGAWAMLPKTHPEQFKRWFGPEREGAA